MGYDNRNVKRPVKKDDVMRKAEDAVREYRTSNLPQGVNSNIQSDVLGSYTGTAYDGDEPEQDADDL